MSLTLLVENNPKVEGFYILNLSTWLGINIVRKKTISEAIDAMAKFDFKLIIVRSVIDKEDAAVRVLTYLKDAGKSVPVIAIGPGPEVPGTYTHIPNAMQVKMCIQSAGKALGITAKEMMTKTVPDFFPIPIHFFSSLKRSVCKLYKQDQYDPNNYVLCFEKNKDFGPSFIAGLISAGNTNLYIDKMDRLEFVNNLTAEFMTLLSEDQLSEDEALSVSEAGLTLAAKKLISLGVNEETVLLAEKSMAALKTAVAKSPSLGKLIDRMTANQQGYLFKHTQILTYVGLHMVRRIKWGNEEQENKIVFVAFFHDIALEDDDQARVRSNAELKACMFPLKENLTVKNHAQIAADIVAKYPQTPIGADQIIRQHHGQLNGQGFSDTYGNNISPLGILFIVAEEFTHLLLKNEAGPFDLKTALDTLREMFPKANFKKMVEVLETIVVK